MHPRSRMYVAALFLALILPLGYAQTPIVPRTAAAQAEVQRIAQAYGFNHFKDVDALRFTFTANLPAITIQRSWVWEPPTDRVTCEWKAWKLFPRHQTYLRGSMQPDDIAIDKWFINDRYWLLFPYQMLWDQSAQITLHGEDPLPIPQGKARHLTVTYPKSGGGYTPGDSYEVFYGSDYRLIQWEYHQGGAAKARLTNTWEGYQRVGPLVLSLEHKNASGNFRLLMTDVAVKLKGSDTWHPAEPLTP